MGVSFLEHLDYTASDIRFTTNGDALYAIVLGDPRQSVTIESLSKRSPHYDREIVSVELLSGGAVRSWSRDEQGLTITLD